MKYIKKYFRYIFIFALSLCFLNFIPFDLDEIWNYGFMHNMYKGLVPYKDFNMVITPFFPFLFSLPFHIFGSNLLIVNVCQSLLLTFTYFILEKLFDKKANIIFIVLIFNYDLIYASYNFFVFFLLLVLLFLENKKANDYIIGIVIGLAVLTKQSIGVCLAVVSLFYLFKDYKKILKRIVGALIPVSIFLIYIFVSNCYKEFFDLCVFGLFDFGKENYIGSKSVLFVFVICLGIILYLIFKDRKDISKYYVLAFSSITIPMFDHFHFKFFLVAMIFIFIDKFKFSRVNLNLLMYGSVIGIFIINYKILTSSPVIYPNDINHFQYRYISEEHIEETKKISNKLKEYSDRKVLLLFEQSYYYKLVNDMPINYFDLINTGNWGYNGSDKLYNALEENNDAVFVIDENSYIDTKQTDKTALNYVLENGRKIDQIYNFEFYVVDKDNEKEKN